MKRFWIITVLAAASLQQAGGAVKALDFEDAKEIALMPRLRLKRMETAVTNLFASSGTNSFRFRLQPWRSGDDQWPLFIMRTPVRDWSGYDRLVIDLVNMDEGGDTLSLSVAGPGVGDFSGLKASITLKPYSISRWTVPLDRWPEKMSSTNVNRIGICVTRPGGTLVYIDNFTLLKPGENPPRPGYSRESVEEVKKVRGERAKARRRRFSHLVRRLDMSGGNSGGMVVGQASTMEHKRPDETFELERADRLSIRLARNEYEGVQIFAVPDGKDLEGVEVEVSPLTRRGGDGTSGRPDVKVYTVGYVKTVKSPSHYRLPDGAGGTKRAPTGWWPDPLLDFVPPVKVKKGAVQGFWINVHAGEQLAAGFYDGWVSVRAANARTVKIPVEVRVNGFTLPKTAVIPMAISFHPPIIHSWDKVSVARKRDPRDITNIWKAHTNLWTDLAADHLISVDYLYPAVPPRFDQLMRLKAQGRLGMFNLGYWRHDDRDGVTGSEEWKKRWFRRLDRSYARAKELGILDHAYLYGEDEIPKKDFDKVAIAAKCLKERYPGVPLLTTAFDPDFGLNGSPLAVIDWYCPLTDMYDLEKSEASRRAGHKVWWYISNLPLTGWANMFVEKEPIETRLLMGAMTEKMKVDGFLFYSICSWKDNRKPITSGPYTDWDPVSYEDYHGCGSWIYPGPDGVPVPTIRLENYRDGLEDLAYIKMLKAKTGKEVPVPDAVMRTMTDFSLAPGPLKRWREHLADMLEK